MADPKQVPDEFKEILPYLQRAQEVAKVDPVVSYFCKYYAVRRAIGSGKTSPESQEYLSKLMDQLELEKGQLEGHEGMKDDATASAHCSLFGLRIFVKADSEDRGGEAGKMTARNFIVASQFLQIVASFGDLPEGISEKIKYAKWRAAEILKAIREGRPPAPVPDTTVQSPSAAPELAPSPPSANGTQGGGGNASDILGWPSPPSVSSPAAGAPPPTTTMANEFTPTSGNFAATPNPSSTTTPNVSSLAGPQPWAGGSQELNVYPTVSPQMQMSTPPQFDTLPSVPHSSFQHNTTPPVVQHGMAPAAPIAPSHYPGPAAVAPGAAAFIPVPASSLPQLSPDASDELVLDPTAAKNAQKHARWAISALEYDDVATSIENLQKAIQLLAPYRK
ncbi:hypothetical protein EV175_002304 [Coemansia sp. RSA 1933]|nr:hypothetical protein EV175_002304 [Coemansia sp. RSA 1933]